MMAHQLITLKGFTIEVNDGKKVPRNPDDYLRARNLDGAIFYRSKSDRHHEAIGLGTPSKSTRLSEVMAEVLTTELLDLSH
jgi:hypothetical protein